GLIGFDKTKKRFVSTWADTMSTGLTQAEGVYNLAENTFEWSSRFSCPLTQKERSVRALTRIESRDRHVFEMYDRAPDGTLFKMMEITYERSK
ncbi:MAG: DUF1579 family protein, partial [Bdellovibrionales bacterium]|nr:DUF1579 family protein [Bdellovibrionales bacterium]